MAVAFRAGRKANGLTGQEVAARAGLYRSVVSMWENGARSPSAETIVRLLDAAGMLKGVVGEMKKRRG